ncbi:MAG TPA: DUF4333 domain-containing protein [Solirubrobacterales bacterium]|nr:DUF4333 domain-containing protein [Solirubrobacterales bacterium]
MKLSISLLAAVAAALIGAGCSADAEVSVGGKSINQGDVEQEIAEGLPRDPADLPDPEVDCDGISDIDVEEGSTFTCTGANPANGEEFPIEVELTNDEGGFRYGVPNPQGGAGRGS